ncbi:serpin family protein [Aestuariibaculum marinum]|uniref:Serpin family protein n=1 Tax=Aestuariibaculum marinum TaxID=2683592 RepID=A0A8J6Q2V3_9FLAO|nr:serpin family protein [Aestuariibaculum marinum]MBD0823158.1 serpin family protein [Aestuariibaculum marinum]
MKLLSNLLALPSILTITMLCISCSTNDENNLEPFNSITKSKEVVSSNNAFAFSLFKEVLQDEEKANVMISPVSASLALGMVYNGANGDTKQAFSNIFNYGNTTLEETNVVNQNIINYITETTSSSTFNIANSLWVNNTFPVHASFIDVNKTFYYAEVQNKDFNNPKTLEAISDWCSNKTNGKIPNALDVISPQAAMYAINALYFKSTWKHEFKKENTKPEAFYLNDNTETLVDMMTTQHDLKYLTNDLFSAVQLPYKNDKYIMTLILPNTDKQINDVIIEMNSQNWETWQNNYQPQEIKLSIPKFKFSYGKKLNNSLTNLGLGIAFSDYADFSGISDIPTKISSVLQKTFIEVNEEGTEAAAVTVIEIETTSVGNQPKQLVLNKTFLFTITEKETGSICFMGKVGNPAIN